MPTTLLFCCHPLTGHVTPVVRIAASLRQRGWRVAFLSSKFFRARIEAAGLLYLPLLGDAALDDDSLFDRGSFKDGFTDDEAARLPPSITDSRHQALFALPHAWTSLQAAILTLADLADEDDNADSDDDILVVSEAFFYGAMPLKYGAAFDCARLLPRSVCISITAPAIRSANLPPFGFPFPPPKSTVMPHFDYPPVPVEDADEGIDASRAEGIATFTELADLWDRWLVMCAPLTDLLTTKLRAAGVPQAALDAEAVRTHMVYMGGANYVCHDAIAQIGVPEFEYPRTDFPAGFRIVGIVPPVVPSAPPPFSWWDAVVANAAAPRETRKKVIVVAQGTVETEPRELIVPTLEIAGARADVLAIAILGVKGATLRSPVPETSLVADYLSYDAVLPFADVWVHNGGYGATMHGIAHGVPMVIAGDTQDKPENGRRVQSCGLGINLYTARPSRDALQTAIVAVLTEPGYALMAKEQQAAYASMDCVGNIEAMIVEQGARK